MRQTDNQHGFTLVEVLVSLTLLSVLSIYALSAFRMQKDMDRISSDIARKIEVRAALDVVRHQLQGMQLVFQTRQAENRNLMFEGRRNTITFADLSDGSRIEGGFYRTTLSVDDNHALVAGFEPIKATGLGPATSIVVLEHVASLEFAYGSKILITSPVDEWLSKDSLPRSIDVQLTLQNEDQGNNKGQVFKSIVAVEMAQ